MNNASSRIVQVALKIPFADTLDYQLTGEIPKQLIGRRVRVPLGKNKLLVGVIIGLKNSSDYRKLKTVEAILDEQPLLNKNTLNLIKKAANYYQVSLGDMLMTALPAWFRKPDNPPIPQETWYKANIDPQTAKEKLQKKQ